MSTLLQPLLGSPAVPCFDPAARTNLYFLVGDYGRLPGNEIEMTVASAAMGCARETPPDENVVVLSDEYLPPFDATEASRLRYRGDRWKTESVLARGITAMANTHPSAQVLIGAHLFRADGRHELLDKMENPIASESDASAFRVCAALWQFRCADPVLYYFVSAAMLEGIGIPPLPLQRHIGERTIYINDYHRGLRRIAPQNDSGWLYHPDHAAVSVWDSEKFRHRLAKFN